MCLIYIESEVKNRKFTNDAKDIGTAFKWPDFVKGFIFKPMSLLDFKSYRSVNLNLKIVFKNGVTG